MADSKIGTGGIIAITLASAAALGGALWLIFKKKKPSNDTQNVPKSNVPKLATTPINPNTSGNKDTLSLLGSSANDYLRKVLGLNKGIAGSGSGTNPSSTTRGNNKIGNKYNPNTGWIQDSNGYWKDPSDGQWYWDNGDYTLTNKETGDIYDSTSGEWVGIDYGDGSWSDEEGRMYVWNEQTNKWDEAGWVYDDGSWSYDDGSLWDYDANGNEVQIGYDNFDGTWQDMDGNFYYEDGSFVDVWGNYYPPTDAGGADNQDTQNEEDY